MSLDTVVEDIREEARARAEEIVAEAEAEAEEIREEREREVEATIDREREQQLSSANLEAKQMRLAARRDALGEIREAAEAAIADLSGDRREALTRTLLEDALEEFAEDEPVVVYGRPDDEELLEAVLGEYDRAELAGERDCLGGVVVEGEDSRVRVNNTFDSVLEGVWEDDLREISARLFEE